MVVPWREGCAAKLWMWQIGSSSKDFAVADLTISGLSAAFIFWPHRLITAISFFSGLSCHLPAPFSLIFFILQIIYKYLLCPPPFQWRPTSCFINPHYHRLSAASVTSSAPSPFPMAKKLFQSPTTWWGFFYFLTHNKCYQSVLCWMSFQWWENENESFFNVFYLFIF